MDGRRMGRWAVAAAAGLLLGAPATAGAWTVTGTAATGYDFVAGPGEINMLTATYELGTNRLRYSDLVGPPAGPLPAGCVLNGAAADCTTAVMDATIALDDLSDQVTMLAFPSSYAFSVDGGPGDDLFVSRNTTDVISGGLGTDTVSYQSSPAGVTAALDGSTSSGGDAAGDVLQSDVERIIGSSTGDDTLTGNGAANLLAGLGGTNTLDGLAGDDTLGGGLGAANTMNGGADDDTFIVSTGADTFNGGGGADAVDYSTSNAGMTVAMTGPAANTGAAAGDTVNPDVENLIGTTADDDITPNAAANVIEGDDGADTYRGTDSLDTFTGGNGADTATFAAAPAGVTALGSMMAETIVGSPLADVLQGTAAAETISAGAGDDNIFSSPGADGLVGGPGIDTVNYGTSPAAVAVALTGAVAAGGDAAGDTVSTDTEQLVGSAFADVLSGSAAGNALFGGDGNDILVGAGGGDVLLGQNGFDTIDYATSPAGVTMALDGSPGSGGDAAADVVTGDDVEALSGSPFGDVLGGRAAPETIDAGGGDDRVLGSGGADTLAGGSGTDTLDYGASSAGVTSRLDDAPGIGGDADGDTTSASMENLVGSAFADTLSGNAGPNALVGGGGDDVLDGAGGTDTYAGGAGADTVSYASSGAGVIATLSGSGPDGETLPADIENLQGGPGSDTLTGDSADNRVDGGDGDDIIRVRDGVARRALEPADVSSADSVTCGGGADTVAVDPADSAAGDCETVDLAGVPATPPAVPVAPVPASAAAPGAATAVAPAPGAEAGGPGGAALGDSPPGVLPSPVARTSANLARVEGVVFVTLPDGTRFRLTRGAQVPTGSLVEAEKGTVTLTSVGPDGRPQTAEFSRGSFRLNLQTPDAATEVVVAGGNFFTTCQKPKTGKAASPGAARTLRAARKRRRVRGLFASGKGRFRTRGRYASATVRGTRWLVTDYCEGTGVQVYSGRVAVRDFVRRRTVTVSGVPARPGRPARFGTAFAPIGPVTAAEKARKGV